MDTFSKLLNGITDAIIQPYESRKIARDEIDSITISTVNSLDMGCETALLNNSVTYIVERYGCASDAEKGHLKWCEKVKAGIKGIELEALGYGDIDNYKFTL